MPQSIDRHALPRLIKRLEEVPAVALLGARQVGKTTLTFDIMREWARRHPDQKPPLYLDLQSEGDRAKLAQPELYLADHLDRLVVLDEVHRAPGLFAVLRGLIDQARRHWSAREGNENGDVGESAKTSRTGMYLLLGSASVDLLKQSGETLAGRISYLSLDPVNLLEHPAAIKFDQLWLRGGFPDSLLAPGDAQSLRWRQDFIRTYLERDVAQFGPRISPQVLRSYWGMLAHSQGGLLNTANLARSLGVDNKTAASYLDLMEGLLLVRRLAPWHHNAGKRLTKSSKVYVRDSGLVHALLGIGDKETLLGHPVVGASWEGFAIENLIASASDSMQSFFYRSAGGAEVDLLMLHPNGQLWVIEIKRSLSPKVGRGFHSACQDLALRHPDMRKFVVYPGHESFALGDGVQAISLVQLMEKI